MVNVLTEMNANNILIFLDFDMFNWEIKGGFYDKETIFIRTG